MYALGLPRSLSNIAQRVVPQRGRAICSSTVSAAASAVWGYTLPILKPLGVGYGLLLALALTQQRRLQYFPSAEYPAHPAELAGRGRPELAALFEGVVEFSVTADDGVRCHGWHWPAPAPDASPASPAWFFGAGGRSAALRAAMAALRREHRHLGSVDLLQYHGNAGDRSHRLAWMFLLREGLGCSVTVLDYRGYGGSDGSPTEAGLIADGAAAAAWLRERQAQLGGKRQLVLWGESIGSGVALGVLAEAAKRVEGAAAKGAGKAAKGTAVPAAEGLVIEAGFSSCVDIGAAAYPFLPVRLGMLDRFDSARRARSLGKSRPPALCLHGTLDDIAPIRFGRKLYEALPGPDATKRFVELEGTGHNDVPYADSAAYLREIARFLSEQVVRS